MTRFPIFSSIVATVPLAVMAWPLAKALQAPPARQDSPKALEDSPTRRADFSIRSAHPFTEVTITIKEASWNFTPEENEKEIHFPFSSSKTLPLLISAKWPEGTPETAILLELMPDGLETRTHTLWGEGKVTQDLIFHWETP